MAVYVVWALRLTYNWARGWPGLHHVDWRYVPGAASPQPFSQRQCVSQNLFEPKRLLCVANFDTYVLLATRLGLPLLSGQCRFSPSICTRRSLFSLYVPPGALFTRAIEPCISLMHVFLTFCCVLKAMVPSSVTLYAASSDTPAEPLNVIDLLAFATGIGAALLQHVRSTSTSRSFTKTVHTVTCRQLCVVHCRWQTTKCLSSASARTNAQRMLWLRVGFVELLCIARAC